MENRLGYFQLRQLDDLSIDHEVIGMIGTGNEQAKVMAMAKALRLTANRTGCRIIHGVFLLNIIPIKIIY